MTPRALDPRRLRCLVVATWYPSATRPVDGIFVRETARAVARCNDVAVLFAEPAAPGEPPARSDRVEDGLRTVRIAFRPLPTRRASLPLRLLALRTGFARLAATGFRPDVVHAHVYVGGAGAVLMGRRAGIPVVVSEHLGAFVAGTLRAPQRRLARWVYEHADLTCPVSDDLGRRLATLAPRATLCTMSNVVDTTIFHPGGGRVDGPPRLLAVGALEPRKRFDQLLYALPSLREEAPIVLDIAGAGPSRGALEALARRLGVSDAVTFHGRQTPHAVATLMRHADVLVLPSIVENQPVVLLEAQACGLPVVATDVGGISEIVNPTTGLLIPPDDPAALTSAITSILSTTYNPTTLSTHAQTHYSHTTLAAQWDTVYRKLIAAR
ncbi:MAG TPA: glycosyltransferase [Baekduia sp.]|jgi:glycosyltransferase involved in cell wall biosynthesis